jgi:hypothetical protein
MQSRQMGEVGLSRPEGVALFVRTSILEPVETRSIKFNDTPQALPFTERDTQGGGPRWRFNTRACSAGWRQGCANIWLGAQLQGVYSIRSAVLLPNVDHVHCRGCTQAVTYGPPSNIGTKALSWQCCGTRPQARAS